MLKVFDVDEPAYGLPAQLLKNEPGLGVSDIVTVFPLLNQELPGLTVPPADGFAISVR